jgi:EAL domain-containing protein (putative c-di-GMP-specific phosphodiesterase class I)
MYEPVVSIARREVVGFQAFARAADRLGGACGEELRSLARESGTTAAWDFSYRAAVLDEVLVADLPAALSILVGIEAETLDVAYPEALAGLLARAEAQLRIFLEFDGPALLANPSRLLAAIARAREARWGVVMRGVAQHPPSAALLRLARPDVVVFDLARLRTLGVAAAARVVNDCMAYCRQDGAGLLVRGVDTIADLNQAQAWHADFVQGGLFGAPTPALEATRPPRRAIPLTTTTAPLVPADPFEAIVADGGVRQLPPRLLAELLRTIEHRCLSLHQPAIVLSCQHAGLFAGQRDTADVADLTAHAAFVGILATRPPAQPPGSAVRVRLAKADPLAKQRILAIIGTDFTVALAARRRDPATHDDRLDVTLTYDPDTAAAVVRTLLSRVPAVPIGNPRILKAAAAPSAPVSEPPDHAAPAAPAPRLIRWLSTRRDAP